MAVPPQPIIVGNLVVDVHRTVHFGGRELDLKPREFGLLEILARHLGHVFTRAHLLDCVWPHDYDDGTFNSKEQELRADIRSRASGDFKYMTNPMRRLHISPSEIEAAQRNAAAERAFVATGAESNPGGAQ